MKRACILFIILAFAVMSFGFFRAGDMVFIPAVANAPGAAGSYWKTDLTIYNPHTFEIYITLEFIPSGTAGISSNEDRVWQDLEDAIPAGSMVTFENVVAQYFPEYSSGAMVVYGYDSSDAPAEKMLVTSRTFTPAPEQLREEDYSPTYGQGIPGVPWYYFGDPDYAPEELDKLVVIGLDRYGDRTQGGFRTNLGILNISINMASTFNVEIFDKNGISQGTLDPLTMGPMSHFQLQDVLGLLGLTGEDYYAVVSITSSTNLNIYPEEAVEEAFLIYGSKVNWTLNDPTYLEASFAVPLDYTCVWPER